ncbi:hypothetical protein C8F01DRAFT_1372731 [Mycena amicta]|nr:hypothetical protein C8F01DRAFT_1372731 [Mycena amicta]
MFFLHALAAALLTHAALTRALVAVSHTPSGKPIFQAPPGSRVQQSGTNMDVFAPNGSLIHVFQNVLSTSKNKKRAPTRRQDVSATEASIVFSDPSSDTVQSLKTSFVVPPEPKTFESQILFFGAGVGTLDNTTGALASILRAALQYGGTNIPGLGGPFWTAVIQLELLPEGDSEFLQIFDPSVNYTLTPGDRLSTSVTFVPNGFPSFFSYNATFDNHPEFSWFEVGSSNPVQVVNLRMEEEGVFQPSDYPAGAFVFEQVEVNLTTGFPDVSWSTDEDPTTNVAVKVEKDGSQDAKVALIFPAAY